MDIDFLIGIQMSKKKPIEPIRGGEKVFIGAQQVISVTCPR